jgi:uncharacterized protein (TIGR02147 family)
MTVFSYLDYKTYLRDLVREQRGVRGYQTLLAEAAGCQRAFISQVLGGSANLTFDHAAGLSKFWNLQMSETEYFFELLQLARAGTSALRTHVRERLERLRAQHSEISTKMKSVELADEQQKTRYYSSWVYAAVHVLSSIPAYQKDMAIAQRLSLPIALVRKTLSELVEMKLLNTKAGRWWPTERNLFLPRHSQMVAVHHSSWHMRALADIHEQPGEESLHYSTLHALSLSDIEKFKEMILEFLKETKTLVEPSPEEEIVCFMLDFFKL